MENKFYIVEAKCGHVGRNNYIVKSFPTKAQSASEAARKARQFGRVKHHWKDAIESVRECSEEEFLEVVKAHQSDPFFSAKCIQDQKMNCGDLDVIALRDAVEKPADHKKNRQFHCRKDRQECKEAWRIIREYQALPAYAY